MCCFCFLIFFYPTIPNASEVDQMVWTSSILELRKSTTLTYINQYRCVGRNNPQLNCTWDFSKSKENKTGLFSPSTFTVLLTLETGLAAFPSFFSKQKCMCLLCTPAVAGSGDARGAGMSQARCGCGSSPFLQRAAQIPHEPDEHVAQQAVHGVPQAGCTQAVSSRQPPAVQKAPEVVMFFVFFLPLHKLTEWKRPTPDSAKLRRYSNWLALSTSEVHWNQQICPWLEDILVSQKISRCCTSPLCPLIWTLQRFLKSTETTQKHPVFSLPAR